MVEITVDAKFGKELVMKDFNIGVPNVITAGLDRIRIELQRQGIYTIRQEDLPNITLSGTAFEIPQNDQMEAHMNEWIQILVNQTNIDIAVMFKYRAITP
jgi:hypothetical protein